MAKASIELIKKDIAQFKEYYNFFIVSIHWGDEYSEYPNQEQISFAHTIIDSGADAIIGHHPHIFQGIEIYKGKPMRFMYPITVIKVEERNDQLFCTKEYLKSVSDMQKHFKSRGIRVLEP